MSRLPPSARSASATALVAPVGVPRSPRTAAVTCASAAGLRLRYPTATLAPARASSTAVARPMPRAPPVTNARFPERSITPPPQGGTRNAEQSAERRRRERPRIAVPRSAFALPRSELPVRVPRSSSQLLFYHRTDDVLDREMNLLNPRRVVRRDHERDVGERLQLAARLAQERDDGHVAGLRRLRRADHVGTLAAGRVQRQHVARAGERLALAREH